MPRRADVVHVCLTTVVVRCMVNRSWRAGARDRLGLVTSRQLVRSISSIVGYPVYGTWAGWDPIFGGSAGFSFSHPSELPYYALLGVLCGGLGLLDVKSFYRTMAAFHASAR